MRCGFFIPPVAGKLFRAAFVSNASAKNSFLSLLMLLVCSRASPADSSVVRSEIKPRKSQHFLLYCRATSIREAAHQRGKNNHTASRSLFAHSVTVQAGHDFSLMSLLTRTFWKRCVCDGVVCSSMTFGEASRRSKYYETRFN